MFFNLYIPLQKQTNALQPLVKTMEHAQSQAKATNVHAKMDTMEQTAKTVSIMVS